MDLELWDCFGTIRQIQILGILWKGKIYINAEFQNTDLDISGHERDRERETEKNLFYSYKVIPQTKALANSDSNITIMI